MAARYSHGEPVNVSITGASANDHYWYDTSIGAVSGKPTALNQAPTKEAPHAYNQVIIRPATMGNPRAETAQQYSREDGYQDKTCYSKLVRIHAPAAAQVGGTFVYSSGATADYQFSTGASSSLGVGASATGSYGSFDASGSTSVTADYSIDYARNTYGSKYHHTYVEPRTFKVQCYTDMGTVYYTFYEFRPTSYAGGSATTAGGAFTTPKYCTRLAAGDTFTKSSSTAITWSVGFKVGGVIGIDLSSRSGFTTASKLVIRSGSKVRRICGHYGLPGSSTPRSIKVSNL